MRRSVHRFATVCLVALAAACSRDVPDEPEAPQAPRFEISEADMDLVLETGSAAAGRLAGTLIQNLTAAMDEGGPEGAIDFCSTEAMPITDRVNASLRGIEVKRTSTRIRNPANAADSLEAAALAWFEEQIATTGSVPDFWVQPEREGAARFYRPLVANAMCVQCHGPVESLSPAVAAALAERYPDDEATGYAPGDLRGLIRVTVPLRDGG